MRSWTTTQRGLVLKKGDLVVYADDGLLVDYRHGKYGLVIATNPIWNGNEIEPARIEVMWPSGEVESIFEDEIEVVNV